MKEFVEESALFVNKSKVKQAEEKPVNNSAPIKETVRSKPRILRPEYSFSDFILNTDFTGGDNNVERSF